MILIKLAIFIFAELGFISANPSPVASFELVRNQQRYPFVAALRKNNKFVCSGAIIAPNAVVTSASCAQTLTPDNGAQLTVTAGITEADADCFAKFRSFQSIKIKNIIVHPGFSKCTENNNDIAIVILESNFAITKHLRPIKIVEGNRPCMSGKTVDIVGWGVSKCGSGINDMAVIMATLRSKGECDHALSPLRRYETMGCAHIGVQPDIWHGTGSPVIIYNKCDPNNHILVGIALNPEKQTKFKNPFVFTEIQDVSNFIRSAYAG